MIENPRGVNKKEILNLTQAMIQVGDRLEWPSSQFIVDKHCVGGLPGNFSGDSTTELVTVRNAHGSIDYPTYFVPSSASCR